MNGTPASCTCDLQCGEIGTCCSDVVITCPDGELEREREVEEREQKKAKGKRHERSRRHR